MMKILFFAFLVSQALFAGITGNIKGVIVDEKAEAIGGVTVVATSPSLQGEQVAMTDEKGLYVISNLPAGIYTLKAMFADATSERKGVEVYIERTVSGDMTLKLLNAGGEVYQITEKANHIDVASSTVGVNLTKDYIQNVPMGRDRNFSNAMKALPSAGSDAMGESVGGATSPENVFVVDGMNSTDPSSGLSGTRMVLEFVDQFDVKEGGYGPEFGRATGGVVNAATKSGGNDFHGSIFTYYRPGFLQANPRLVSRVNDSVTRRGKLGYYLNTGFELGGPIVEDKLWFHIGYSPELQKDFWIRDLSAVTGTDSSGQSTFGPTFYSQEFSGFAQSHQYTFKLTHEIDDNNRQSLGIRGAPTFFEGAVGTPFDSDAPTLSLNGDPSTFQFKQWGGNLATGVYNYAGKYWNDKLKLDATVGIHHQQSHWWPTAPGGSSPRVTYMSNVGLNTVWDNMPNDSNFLDNASKSTVRNYSKGGIGSFNDSLLTRISEKVMLTSLFDFAGLHQLKYGVDFEQLRGSKEHGYTGGVYYQRYENTLKETMYNIRGQGIVDAAHGFKIPSLSQTLNWGLFVGDSWNPTPQLTINYGLRWEAQDFYGVKTPAYELKNLSLERKFSILDNVAPRAGLVWDFLGNGKGVVRFNYGRYYESIPMDINERAFGGEGSRIRVYNCPPGSDYLTCAKTPPTDNTTLGGLDSIVAPGLKGQYSDELILSADYEPISSWVFGVAGVYRSLGRVIEDMSTDGGQSYMFGNPGQFDVNTLGDIRNEINHEQDPARRMQLEQNFQNLSRITEFPEAIRNIWQLQFRLDKKLSDNFVILGTYVLSWAKGNYPGLFSATNGQLDPNLSSQFDLPQLLLNRMGYLPQDQRHRIKLSGFYKAGLKEFGIDVPLSFNIGLSGVVQSGTPYEVLGADLLYGSDEIFILPRGSGGRTPWTWSVDLNVGMGYDITPEVTAELFASFFNLTNNRDPVAYDDTYTYDFVRPIRDGDKSQLDYAVNTSGKPVTKNPNYGNAVAFQAPFSTQVGFRLKF
ncbi:MAG: carboxypeptidase regulatory-like domain-containing protein [Myxococcota bacterium]